MSHNIIKYMRTTIRIQDSILQDAKKKALELKISLTALIEYSLQEQLYKSAISTETTANNLPIIKGNGLHPGIDLNNSQDLLDKMGGL